MSSKKDVLIPTMLDPIAKDVLEESGGYTVFQEPQTDLLALSKKYPSTYALIVRSEPITEEVIDAYSQLRIIVRAGTGFNTIDTRYARKRNIDVINTPGANANAVAELVAAMLLADARHLLAADVSVRAGKWEKKKFMGNEISHKTLGIIGLGAIGQRVAKRLSGFEMRMVGYDPLISAERVKALDIEVVDLSTVFATSDYITLHIPENDQTRDMINLDLLGKMKAGSALINCARYGIIDEEALRKVKNEKPIRFLNDVYPKDEAGEKPIAEVSDLMTPHLGASTKEANANAARLAAEHLIEFDAKGISSFIVNRDIPEGLDRAYGELAFTLARLSRNMLRSDTKLRRIETSFYGKLKPFAEWLLVPVVAALSKDFDRTSSAQAAQNSLKEMGIEYINRETDSGKAYENSITLDLTVEVDAGHLICSSMRGTVAEGNLMISRINDFDKLYFEPVGHNLFFTYEDRTGILGRIGAKLSEKNINIDDVRNPHNSKGTQSIAILKVNKPVDNTLIQDIQHDIKADSAFYIAF